MADAPEVPRPPADKALIHEMLRPQREARQRAAAAPAEALTDEERERIVARWAAASTGSGYYSIRDAWEAAVEEAPEDVRRLLASEAHARAERDAALADAERWRWLCWVMEQSVGGGLEVKDERLVYQEPEPGAEVRVYWYPDTPIGFYEAHGRTLAEAADAGMTAEWRKNGKPMSWRALASSSPTAETRAASPAPEGGTATNSNTPEPLT